MQEADGEATFDFFDGFEGSSLDTVINGIFIPAALSDCSGRFDGDIMSDDRGPGDVYVRIDALIRYWIWFRGDIGHILTRVLENLMLRIRIYAWFNLLSAYC